MASVVERDDADSAEPLTPKGRATGPNMSIEELSSMEETTSDDGARDSADGFESASSASPAASPSPITTPPYWLNTRHRRSVSNVSVDSGPASGGITMLDHDGDDRNETCWARSVEVNDYVVVNNSATNIGAFVVWNIKVETLNGSYMNIRKRYSEFDNFRRRLVLAFPNFEAAVPLLPPKSMISKFRPRFLEKRRAGLQYFLHCILLNPEFSGSQVLKDFLFA